MGSGMECLQKDFMPSDLKPLLDKTGFDGTIAVQARQCIEETQWLLELSDQYSFIRGIVGWVDLRSDKLIQQLDQFSYHPKFRGVRHVVHDEPDDNFMLRDDFLQGISKLPAYKLTYDLLLFPKHIPVAIELVKRFPNQLFVLDHIVKPFIKDGIISPWDKEIKQLASFDNVFCKVSGMVTEADWKSWGVEDFTPYLDVIFECFGTDRIMLGSDWPVCTVAGEYKQIMQIPLDYIEQLSQNEKNIIYSKNALHFYGIN